MSVRNILNKLNESNKYYDSYRGIKISIDDDNLYHITIDGKNYTFETMQELEDYVDDLPAKVRYSTKPERMYLIYVKGTYKNFRAKYLKKNGRTEFSNEAQADKFPESRMRAILRNSSAYDSYPVK